LFLGFAHQLWGERRILVSGTILDFEHLILLGFSPPPDLKMATARILHVGEDTCHRIPVMERAGLVVCRTVCSVDGVRGALASNEKFSALTFHIDADPIPHSVLTVARSLPSALVLFENPGIEYDPQSFDLVIPTQTPPLTWLRCLQSVIRSSQELRTSSRQLRDQSAAVRSDFRQLCATMRRHRVDPIDLDRIWRGDKDEEE
jgi:hypothetical protein